MRNERSELSAKFKKADAELIEAQNQLKAAMLEHCEEHGVESVRLKVWSTKQLRKNIGHNDWDHFHAFVLESS